MASKVESQKFKNVDVDNPRIVEYTKNMLKRGDKVETISKVIGMPVEVIERIKRDAEQKP